MGSRRYYTLSSLIRSMKKNKVNDDLKEVIAALEKEGWYLGSSRLGSTRYYSALDRDPEDDTGGELEDYGDDDG